MTMLKAPITLGVSLLLCLAMAVPAAGLDEDRGAQTYVDLPCSLAWLDADLQNIQLDARGTAVVRPEAGTFTVRCKLTVPEDDPSIASFDTVCGVVGEFCVNGAAIVGYDLLVCGLNVGSRPVDGVTAASVAVPVGDSMQRL